MGCRVTQANVVRVFGAIVHVPFLGDLGEEKPHEHHRNNALPQALTDLVPHLVVKSVDLLQALQVILFGWSVGQCPDSEIVHVCHVRPRVFKLYVLGAWLQELVLESMLPRII